MHRGYVRDYRKGIENPLFKKPLVWHFWNYCRLRANHKDTVIDFNGKPFELKRGCFMMSLGNASKNTGLSLQNIRTAIKVLSFHKMIEKSTDELTKQATIIKVVKFDLYNPLKKESNKVGNKEPTQSQHSANTVLTIDNNEENVNNEEDKKTFLENSDEFRLSQYLLNRIKKHSPNIKKPDLQKWSKDADYVLRLDKRNIEECKKLIKFIHGSDEMFYRNVLSVSKFRKRYDEIKVGHDIYLSKKNRNGQQKTSTDETNEYLDKLKKKTQDESE